MRHLTLTALACWALTSPARVAFAQEPATPTDSESTADSEPAAESEPPPPPDAAPRMTPPQLVRSAEPVYPEAHRQIGAAATVGLVLTLDVQGRVIDAGVAQSGGADFDAAALAAARELVFSPALSGDTPVASKIPYRFEFALAPAAPPAPVVNAVTPSAAVVDTTKAEPSVEGSLDIEVEGERPPREPTVRVLQAEEITKIPGTNGDALRGVLNLPGLAQPPGLAGLLIVRGSSPRDSQVFVDGTNVPIVYHFGGLSSVVPSELLERIDFYPGNFGPEYGRASGGIIDVGIRSPKKEGYGGLFQLDLLDARLVAEGALTDDTRILLAGRRSWVDAWLKPVLEEAGSSVRTAPVYYDYQAMIEHDASNDTTLRLLAFGSDDRLDLLLASPDSSDPAAGGDVFLHTGFWRVQGRVDTRLSNTTRWVSTLSVGKDIEQFGSGNIDLDIGTYVLDARTDLRAQLLPELAVSGGFDVQTGDYDVAWRAPPIDIDDGDTSGPLFGRPLTELEADGTIFRPSAYAQAEVTPLRGLRLLPGVRADYGTDTEEWTFDPRLGVRYDLYPSELRTTLKGGIGMFHKPPEPYEVEEPFGTPGIGSERGTHYSLGLEQELSRHIEVSVEGFYKDLDKLAVSRPSADTESGSTYANDGTGRSYGGEFLLRYKADERFFGWVAYTLSKSERKNTETGDWELFDYDQTHILTALASVKLGRGWQLGSRFRYITGTPYTPYIGGVLDHDAGAYAGLQSIVENGSRLPARHQLDLRIDKTWTFQSWKLSTYLDVQNVYNRENTENISYNYDYSESEPLPGLPILPILGIRGEL